MSNSSPHAESTAPLPTYESCEICGCKSVGITFVGKRCSPCFWARSQDKDPSLWKAPMNTILEGKYDESGKFIVKLCAHQHCPFDASPGQAFCPAHDLPYKEIVAALKFDEGKLPLDLLPFEALEEISLVLQHGAKKYEAHNWRKGFIYSRPFSAILRHLFAYWKGEDLDKDSGLHHLAHAGCELLFLLSFVKTKTGVDDRYGKPDS